MTNHPMTPRPQPAASDAADALRSDYRHLMRMAARETFDKDEALELVHICVELGRLGYVLTADETDWQPPARDRVLTLSYGTLSKLARSTVCEIAARDSMRQQGRPVANQYPGRATEMLLRTGWIQKHGLDYSLTPSARVAIADWQPGEGEDG